MSETGNGMGLYRSLRPLDWLFLLYTAYTGFLVAGGDIGDLGRICLLGAHGILLLVPFLLHRYWSCSRSWGRFIHISYPLFFLIFFYRELDLVNRWICSFPHDEEIQALDRALGTANLRDKLIDLSPSPWLEGFLNAGYFSYYFLLPAVGVPLALKRRWDALEEFVFVSFLAYVVCYTFYTVYPVNGPFLEAHPEASFEHKDWMSRLTYTIVANWGSTGAAFPSSHVAAALVIAVLARRLVPKAFWFLGPVSIWLTCATVYGGYHYAVDALAGVLTAAIVLALAPYVSRALERLSRCIVK
ncbi:MAG: phosphatase PAP2 family protein [bacterium]